MCSSNIVYSSESARGVRVEKCGEVTQDICVDNVVVNYLCESDMPSSEDARQICVEKIKVGDSKIDKRRGGDVQGCTTAMPSAKPSGEPSVEPSAKPFAKPNARPLQEVIHSVNTKNRNRIRRSLLRQRYWIGQQPGLADEDRGQMIEEIQQQLALYPPRSSPIKSSFRPNSSKLKNAKSVGPKICPACDLDRGYKASPCSVKHFCKPSSRIRREIAYDKVCSRSKSSRRKYNVGSWRGQR